MNTPNHKPRIVNSSCPYVVDQCARQLLRPLPGSRFEIVGDLDELAALAERQQPLVSLWEAAQHFGYQRKTFYHWAAKNRLRKEHGVLKVNGRYRVDLPILKGCFDRGEF